MKTSWWVRGRARGARLAPLAAALAAWGPAPMVALAQTAAAPAVTADPEVIVVTVRRVSEAQQDVPVSVNAFGAAQLQAAGITQLEDVARLTPGFAFDRSAGGLVQPAIRGQAQSRITNPVQNVASFFNGIYLQRSYQVDGDMLGLERLEVIKGPQSALFGRNAFAGAISYITQRPVLGKTLLSGEITVGDHDRQELRVMGSFGLGDRFAIGVAANKAEFDGTWPNNNALAAGLSGGGVRTYGRLNGHDNRGTLVQVRLLPHDDVEVNAFVNVRSIFTESPTNYQMSTRGLVANFNVMNCTPFETPVQARLGTNALVCGALPASPVLAPGEPRSPGLVADPRAYSQDALTKVGGITVDAALTPNTSLSVTLGRTEAESLNLATLARDPQRGIAAPPFTGLMLFDYRGNGDIHSDSLEARVTYETKKLRAMAGLYLAKITDFEFGGSYLAAIGQNTALSDAAFPVGNLFVPPGFTATQREEDVKGLFGSIGAEVAPGLRVTFEGRQTREELVQQAMTYPAREGVGPQLSRAFSYFTPRLTVDYKPAASMLLFASAAQGVKSGGFNPGATLAEERIYEPEKNWTYELGVKSTLLGGALLLNGSLYRVDWTDLQVNRAQSNSVIGTPLIVGNVSGANIDGLELQARLRVSSSLSLDAGFSHSRARFKAGATDPVIPRALCQNPATLPAGSAPCPYNADIGGKTVPRAPADQAMLGLTWKAGLGSLFGQPLALTTRADASYQSKAYVDNTNTSWTPARTLVNASLTFDMKSVWLRLWARNLTNRAYVSSAFVVFAGSGPGTGVTYAPLLGDQRTAGVTLGMSY